MATVQAVSKLLQLSTSTLKRLEATKELIASRNEVGSRRYNRSDVESYIAKNEAKISARLSKSMVKETKIKETEMLLPDDPFGSKTYRQFEEMSFEEADVSSMLCQRCQSNEIFAKNYCTNCLEDFMSKVEVCKLLNINHARLERLLEEYPEHIRTYPYKAQQRMSREEVVNFIATQPPEKITKGGRWSPKSRHCRVCKTTDNEHYAGGYCVNCYPKTKEAKLMQGYLEGNNLAEIGKELGFSRERARQLFNKSVCFDIERLGDVSEREKQEIRNQIELTHKQSRSLERFNDVIDREYENIVQKLTDNVVKSEAGMLRVIGLPASAIHVIKDEYPEFLEIVSNNKNQWTLKYDKCVRCGTTEAKHKMLGYCQNCYTHSPQWKEQQSRWRTANIEKIRESRKIYEREYLKRPEVKKRMVQKGYMKRYDGKRETTIELAGYKCEGCGMSREAHKEKYKNDLSVYHKNGDLKDNAQTNLIALCRSCLAKLSGTKNLNK